MNIDKIDKEIIDSFNIKGNSHIYRKRKYRLLPENVYIDKKYIYRFNNKKYILIDIELISILKKIEIVQKYIDKLNIKQWEKFGVKEKDSVCFVENELDWLSSFILSGLEEDDIMTLDKFISPKKLYVIETSDLKKSSKKIRYKIVSNIYTDLEGKEKDYFSQIPNNSKERKGYTKEYKLFKEIDWCEFDLELSGKQSNIIYYIKQGLCLNEIANKLNMRCQNVVTEINLIKRKLCIYNDNINSYFLKNKINKSNKIKKCNNYKQNDMIQDDVIKCYVNNTCKSDWLFSNRKI